MRAPVPVGVVTAGIVVTTLLVAGCNGGDARTPAGPAGTAAAHEQTGSRRSSMLATTAPAAWLWSAADTKPARLDEAPAASDAKLNDDALLFSVTLTGSVKAK